MNHKHTLFIFRQDLRTIDNTGLLKAVKNAEQVTPIFIVDTDILEAFPDHDKRIGFQLQALMRLRQELQELGSNLFIFHGKSKEIIPSIVELLSCDSIVRNKSYGYNAYGRDATIKKRAKSKNITTYEIADYLLVEPHIVEQRKVFTPFYKLWMEIDKQYMPQGKPQNIVTHTLEKDISSTALLNVDKDFTEILQEIGGAQQPHWDATAGQSMVKNLSTAGYEDTRNFPGTQGTSRLSPYLSFGIVSIRQVFNKTLSLDEAGVSYDEDTGTVTMDRKVFKNTFVSELARREYRHHASHYFPWTREKPFQEKRQGLARQNNKERFEHWKKGTTGYPIVDAAMKQLQEENWMHGRTRMIVASFLTKDLLIDWKWGEEHFKKYLLDYDTSVNIGNWQWSASVGVDPKPLRIFSPLLQSERYDPDALYIKKWLPELEGQPLKAIHNPLKFPLKYTPCIVDHSIMQRIAKSMYKKEDIQSMLGFF